MAPDTNQNQIDEWTVEARPGGWLRLQQTTGTGASVYLRYLLSGTQGKERLTLQTIVMKSDDDSEGLSGRVWRAVPLSKVEQALAPLVASDLPAPQAQAVAEMREAFRPSHDGGDKESFSGVDELDHYFEEGDPVDLLERITAEIPEAAPPTLSAPEAGELRPPEGRLTDEFLKRIASAHRYFAARGPAPAREIAERANVPVRTVHRWVLKAREKGFLPPARRGRAG